MKISRNWLQTYFKNPLPDNDALWNNFTFHLCEVESVDQAGEDSILDLNILPNRAHDCLCHKGIAQELSAILDTEFIETKAEKIQGEKTNLKVRIDTPACRRYMARIVRNVSIGESSSAVKDKLLAIGQKTINGAVDAGNFVLFDKGQPVHVFDLDKLENEEIIVRNGKEGEILTTLDDKEVALNSDIAVISDSHRALALAGIKGGKTAEVTKDTKNILIEVANFDPISVRKTARKQGLLTDAAKRFENDLSPELCEVGMYEVTKIILEECKTEDTVVEEIVDIYPNPQVDASIEITLSKVNKRLGSLFTEKEVEDVFRRLRFEYEKKGDVYHIKRPLLRLDLVLSEDIVEEVGRILGYERVVPQIPKIDFEPKINEMFFYMLAIRKYFFDKGFSEVMTYTLSKKGEREVSRGPKGKSFLRKNISDGLKESVELNRLNAPLLQQSEVKIFEIGTVFLKDSEEMHVAWGTQKEIFEMTLAEFVKKENISIENDYTKLSAQITEKKFSPWSPYPFIVRDISVWMDETHTEIDVKNAIESVLPTSLLALPVHVIDTFEKDGKISKTFRIIFQSNEKTLTDEDVFGPVSAVNNKIAILGLKIR